MGRKRCYATRSLKRMHLIVVRVSVNIIRGEIGDMKRVWCFSNQMSMVKPAGINTESTDQHSSVFKIILIQTDGWPFDHN